MKIEKINENQIRCTLTSEDLASRKIRISELAYGTEKAKSLFQDMMQQANMQFGFEADNIPLMIEAIPVNHDGVVLIITKVEDPEELDTRFSKFAPMSGDSDNTSSELQFSGADDILDLFQKLYDSKKKSTDKKKTANAKEEAETLADSANVPFLRMYQFDSLDGVIHASRILGDYFNGKNSLYKEHTTGTYDLVLHKSDTTPADFNKVCNILSEYGYGTNYSTAAEAHLIEHSEIIISNTAIQDLSTLV
ncbi:MAG: adaptor protein MecA [Lachnospiraceae bacterium]|nr:adaptor protein MecA [Lachnospiraceae bacterium]